MVSGVVGVSVGVYCGTYKTVPLASGTGITYYTLALQLLHYTLALLLLHYTLALLLLHFTLALLLLHYTLALLLLHYTLALHSYTTHWHYLLHTGTTTPTLHTDTTY